MINKFLLILSFVFCSCTLIAFGQIQSSQLKVSLNNKATIRLSIDGQEYFQQKDMIIVDKINPGIHRLKVFYITKGESENKGLLFNKKIKIFLGKQTEIIINSKRKTATIKYYILKENEIDHLNDHNGRHPSDPIDRSKK